METKIITVTEIVRNFSDYINRILYRGEHFILTKGNRKVAEIRPVAEGLKLADFPALLESLPPLDEEDKNHFLSDIKDARESTKNEIVRDPWAS